jgi:hypothetical protein
MGSRANGEWSDADADSIGRRQGVEKMGRILLEDLEDLRRGGRRLKLVLGMAGGQAEAMNLAMRKCKEKYFSELVYEGKFSCMSTLGRLAKVLGKVYGKGKEKPSSARRKIEWWLRLKERVSIGGKDALIKEMYARYKRDEIREAEVAAERFSIDWKGQVDAVVCCLVHESLADIVRGLSHHLFFFFCSSQIKFKYSGGCWILLDSGAVSRHTLTDSVGTVQLASIATRYMFSRVAIYLAITAKCISPNSASSLQRLCPSIWFSFSRWTMCGPLAWLHAFGDAAAPQ